MPSYNLSEIMSFATFEAGRRADLAQSDVSRMVNESYLEVAVETQPEGLERLAVSSTTTGENKISLPSDYYEPISATLIYQPSWSTLSSAHSSHYTLRRVAISDMDARNPQPSGIPIEIAFYADWMELHPSPNSAYSLQLRYRSQVTDMSATTDVPSVGTPWRRAIVIKTKKRIFDAVGDQAGAMSAEIEYQTYVSKLKTDAARRQAMESEIAMKPLYGSYGGRRRVK
jgi:hypothetical protein